MATEADIRRAAIALLEADGWVVWFPKRSRLHQGDTDIFGVFDLLAGRLGDLRFIQLTDTTHLAHRRAKVEAFLRSSGLTLRAEVWGYREDSGTFRVAALAV